jgi:hypothetical protein
MFMMSKCLNIFGRKQQGFTDRANNDLAVELVMPACYQGKTVPTSIVLMELLWQHYGLDLLHPKLSRWMELNAPDVKYAAARSTLKIGQDSGPFKVGPKGTIRLQLSLDDDDRLREVSSQYIFSQIKPTFEPHTTPRLAA